MPTNFMCLRLNIFRNVLGNSVFRFANSLNVIFAPIGRRKEKLIQKLNFALGHLSEWAVADKTCFSSLVNK